MPTYRNTTSKNINMQGKGSENFVAPSKTLKTDMYYDIEGLELVSDDPIYTPLISEQTVNGTINQEIPISISLFTEFILFKVDSGEIEIHNIEKGYKIVTLKEGEIFGWEVKKRSRQLIIVFKSAGSMILSQFNEKCEIG